MNKRRTVVSTLGLLAVSGLILTGCAGLPGGPQSKAQACKSLEADISGASSTLSSAISTISSDPAEGEKALKAFNVKLSASVAKVTNSDVKKAGKSAVDSLDAFDADLAKYAADKTDTSAIDALQKDSNKLQTAFNKLATTCKA
jgi:hypothetical protein